MVTIQSLSYNQYLSNPRPFVLPRHMLTFEISNCKKYEYTTGPISGINSWNVFNVLIIMTGILDAKWYKKKLHSQRKLTVFIKVIRSFLCRLNIELNWNFYGLPRNQNDFTIGWKFKQCLSWKTRQSFWLREVALKI